MPGFDHGKLLNVNQKYYSCHISEQNEVMAWKRKNLSEETNI
jgi:hypothetical protein